MLNNRNCNLAFEVRLVKLHNQIEEREHSAERWGSPIFKSSVSLEKLPSIMPSAEAQICNYRTILKYIVKKMQQTNTSNH
jgi:hypothetical protein